MELAALLGVPYSQLDQHITTRDYALYVEYYAKNHRFPGQREGL